MGQGVELISKVLFPEQQVLDLIPSTTKQLGLFKGWERSSAVQLLPSILKEP